MTKRHKWPEDYTLCYNQKELDAAVAAERDECAKIASGHAEWLEKRGSRSCGEAYEIADSIRERGGK